jgi:hypothetical protein
VKLEVKVDLLSGGTEFTNILWPGSGKQLEAYLKRPDLPAKLIDYSACFDGRSDIKRDNDPIARIDPYGSCGPIVKHRC